VQNFMWGFKNSLVLWRSEELRSGSGGVEAKVLGQTRRLRRRRTYQRLGSFLSFFI